MLFLVVIGLVSWLFDTLTSDETSVMEQGEPTQMEEGVQVEVNPASGGLGLTVDEWRAVHGMPFETQFDEVLDRYRGSGGYYVDIRFVINSTDRMTHIDITFDPPVEPAVAEAIVADYLPADATLVREYRDDLADRPVTLYHSDWLGETLGTAEGTIGWGDAEPGAFFVMLWWQNNDPATGKMGNAVIGLSHRP